MLEINKIRAGRYEIVSDNATFVVFKDSYKGMWRTRVEGGPVDWAEPCLTKKEALIRVYRHLDEY